MPRRDPLLVTKEIYHVFNRGVEKRKIFLKERDYRHFLDTLSHYLNNTSKLSSESEKIDNSPKEDVLEIMCYCLMPNHFHLLVKQRVDLGISKFMGRVQNSYTKYFNTKNDRVGPLFQGVFKAVRIENDEQLLHVSRYIHLNPLVNNLVSDLKDYKWSSFHVYIDPDKADQFTPVNKEQILSELSSNQYESFILDQIDYAKSLEEIKHHLLD